MCLQLLAFHRPAYKDENLSLIFCWCRLRAVYIFQKSFSEAESWRCHLLPSRILQNPSMSSELFFHILLEYLFFVFFYNLIYLLVLSPGTVKVSTIEDIINIEKKQDLKAKETILNQEKKLTVPLPLPDNTFAGTAKKCGFSGASYFSETFKKYAGMTPKEYYELHKH